MAAVSPTWLGFVNTKADNLSFEQSAEDPRMVVVKQSFTNHLLDPCASQPGTALEGTSGEMAVTCAAQCDADAKICGWRQVYDHTRILKARALEDAAKKTKADADAAAAAAAEAEAEEEEEDIFAIDGGEVENELEESGVRRRMSLRKPSLVPIHSEDKAATHRQRLRTCGAQEAHFTAKLACSLIWENTNDLDLVCRTPCGEQVSFRVRAPPTCGGELDIDANAHKKDSTATPVENIMFLDPAPGTYHFFVDGIDMEREGGGATPFHCLMVNNGATSEVAYDDIQEEERITVFTVDIAA